MRQKGDAEKHIQAGKEKNLIEYQPVVFLSQRDGDVFARACWARKDYQGELDAPPLFMDTLAYHFRPGTVTKWTDWYGKWESEVLAGNYDPRKRKINEPFKDNGGYVAYHVYGWEAIEESPFYKYCQYDEFSHKAHDGYHGDLMKYLAAYSIYPKNIEMLMKCGKRQYVEELLYWRKNARAIKWGEDEPKKAFGLNGQELRAYMGLENGSPEVLTLYKKLRRAELPISFETAARLHRELDRRSGYFADRCIERGIKPDRLIRYLEKFTGPRCYGGWFGLGSAFQLWTDYVSMAEALGWELGEQTVLLPRDLTQKHDEAARERQLQLDAAKREEDEERRRQAEPGLERRRKKYNFELDGFFIRIAENEEEILAEGRELMHCVGGYAQRHMAEQTTILFMRPCEDPDLPFVTVEMKGDMLIQAHGYRNERGGGKAPRELFAGFFDRWLEWVEAGSPRDKTGAAKIKRRKSA